MTSQRFSKLCRASVLVGTSLGVFGTAGNVMAQALILFRPTRQEA